MPRIIIAGASEASRTQLHRLLSASGFGISRLCASDAELRRALAECEDGVAILAGGLSSALPDALAADFGEAFLLLLIARPEALERCESPNVFKLAYPCAGSAVVGAVEMLIQLHAMRLPKRSEEDRALVEEAKRRLMLRDGIDEPTAHRRMQVYAMRHGVKMTDCAAEILNRDDQ